MTYDDDARIVGPLLFEWQPGADGADAADAIESRSTTASCAINWYAAGRTVPKARRRC